MRCVADLGVAPLRELLGPYGLSVHLVGRARDIPGSFWGAPEAGLNSDGLHVRADTPVHSALHEACHWICMDDARRYALDTDAGGDDIEECAVCYLQAVLAPALPGYSTQQLFTDMDAWGYSFRNGGARAWFEADAQDARQWLLNARLISDDSQSAASPSVGRAVAGADSGARSDE